LLKTGLSALTVPESLWKQLDKEQAASIAATVIPKLYAKRLEFPDHLSWLLAPEMVLLNRAPAAHQEALAEQMLRVRAGIAPHQTRLAQAKADYADKKTAVAGKLVQLLDDTHQQLQSRKRLAAWGPWMLLGTTIFAALALAAVVVMLGMGKVDGWGAALLVFVLALFAISPAVLLINERPLQGLDKWMPGGSAAADDTASTSTDAKKDEPADKPAAKPEAK
jgi:hypothetical protein